MDKPTLLIVDDEPANLAVFSRLLNPYYQVRACKSGEQALLAANSEPYPDLILLDVMMPGMDGYRVLERLREEEKSRRIPVIFVTALSDDLDEERGLQLGAVDYIAKPVNPAIMLARVQTHLEIKQSRDRLARQNDWLEAEVQRRIRENLLIQDVTLSVLLELTETRDEETGNHILRTQSFVERLGRRLQSHPDHARELSEPRLTQIVKAAPLHDIGKIGIPDSILLKPGKLTPEEWEIMKTHTRIGAEAIRKAIDRSLTVNGTEGHDVRPESLSVLETARVIAANHHEKWDGSGYPQGLAGPAIPLAARLMALADVFDALTTRRCYKAPWTGEQASAYIRQESGRHFDPEVVEAFEALKEDFFAIQQRLSDPADPTPP